MGDPNIHDEKKPKSTAVSDFSMFYRTTLLEHVLRRANSISDLPEAVTTMRGYSKHVYPLCKINHDRAHYIHRIKISESRSYRYKILLQNSMLRELSIS